MKKIFAAAFATLLFSQANAHIVLTDPVAPPSTNYAGLFRVSHGCENTGTISLRIEIPAGVEVIRAEPEQGWKVSTQRKGANIAAVVFSYGYLPPKARGHFGILMRTPDKAGTVYFPTVQSCEKGENRWTEIPTAGQDWHDVPHPAPVLNIREMRPAGATLTETPPPEDHSHHH